MTSTERGIYHWHFFRAGGFDQVKLERGADLLALAQLDQKLWVALSCPTRGIEFDSTTLDLIDTDKDGRIRAPEIIAAVHWAGAVLKDPDQLIKAGSNLPLDAINDGTPEGRQLLASARRILTNLGLGQATTISVDETTDTKRIFAQTKFNGDGVLPADSSDDPKIQAVIADIIACAGGEIDRSGKPGITQSRFDAFFENLAAYSEWWQRSQDNPEIMPLGNMTPDGAAALAAVKAKVDDYFTRCRVAAFDPRALLALNRNEAEYVVVGAKSLSAAGAELADFPLAQIAANTPLPLNTGLNPAWTAAMENLRVAVIKPLLGERSTLTAEQWNGVKSKFTAYDAWMAAKAGGVVEKLGFSRIREILQSNPRESIAALLAQDLAEAPAANFIAMVDQLVRFNRDLHKLLCNYVNFSDFYGRRNKAVFQSGTLYLDQRSCDLCIRVTDAAKHSTMAHLSQAYLAYCDLTRKATGETMQIAAAFTGGDSDNLMVGRNGIFYDRQGRDWDATITKIVENPISIRQSFFSPYKRLLRWVEDQIAKRAAAADAAANDRLTQTALAVQKAEDPAKSLQKPKIDIGVVAAIGVAVGGITAALGALLQAFFGLGIWMPLGLVALVLLISGPSMIIAALKLRQRNLGPILDANGWAVNAKARINIPFGTRLTGVPRLPPGSQRDLIDPYAESHQGRNWFIVLLLLVIAGWSLWNFGVAENFAPGVFPKSGYVQRREDAQAKAEKQAAEAADKANNIKVTVTATTTTAPAP